MLARYLRRRLIGGAALVAGLALASFGAMSAMAQATPGASPVASPVATAGHPAHIHSGTCDKLGDVKFPLADVTMPTAAAGTSGLAAAIPVATSVTVVKVTLDQVLAAQHAINVHVSTAQIQDYIACGNIGGTPTDGNLLVGLSELHNSGYSGIGWLHANSDGTTTVSIFLSKGLSAAGAAMGHATGTPTTGATPVATPAS